MVRFQQRDSAYLKSERISFSLAKLERWTVRVNEKLYVLDNVFLNLPSEKRCTGDTPILLALLESRRYMYRLYAH